jgi:holo-[acyl-carrier protein] synthase
MNTPRIAAGCDVVEVARLSAAIDRRDGFLARLFTDREIADARRGGAAPGSPVERARLAARFAAKEATRKAVGDLRLPFHDVEVRTEPDGCPVLYVRGERSSLTCSLSHDAGVAMAIVVGTLAVDDPPTGPSPDAQLPVDRLPDNP